MMCMPVQFIALMILIQHFVVKFVYLLKFKYNISELLEVSLFFGFIAEEPGSAFK